MHSRYVHNYAIEVQPQKLYGPEYVQLIPMSYTYTELSQHRCMVLCYYRKSGITNDHLYMYWSYQQLMNSHALLCMYVRVIAQSQGLLPEYITMPRLS